MATHHAASGEIVNLRPLTTPLHDTQSTTLVREEQLKVLRLVLPAGKELPDHAVNGPITMHCLQGIVNVTTQDRRQTMCPGDFMYLAGRIPHTLLATEDATMLLTIVVEK
jgi:quercetin dioxygenase-like cupin family protein